MDDDDSAPTTEQLRKELEELEHEAAFLESENLILESYCKRSNNNAGALQDQDENDKKARHRRQKLQGYLSMEQKIEIASTEFEHVQKDIQDTKKSSERLIDTLRAVLEETDIRIAELKKEAYEFKRDIVVGAENFRTGKTMAEKVVRYMEEKLRQKDSIVEKLRLKNATLKTQGQKVDAQLRQKEEMGDVLHYIDFHQLQIENKQYLSKIEERNDELLQLKMMTGNSVQTLNNLKRKLKTLMDESTWLKTEMKARNEANRKLTQETAKVHDKIKKESLQEKRLQKETESTNTQVVMPNVLDYVGQKAYMYDLEREVQNLERKLEIAQLAAKARARESKKTGPV